MTPIKAISEAFSHYYLRPDHKLSAHTWHRLPKDVRETLANVKSEDFKNVAIWSIFGDKEHWDKA